MRLRLGVLRDTAAAERQAAAEAAARKHKPTSPTVKTEAQAKAQEAAEAKAKAAAEEAAKPPQYHIRPLSESKAIESGATFISEGFLFLVAGGLIVFESWRSKRKDTTRREDVESRLVGLQESIMALGKAVLALEKEVLHLKAKDGESIKSMQKVVSHDIRDIAKEEEEEEVQEQAWWQRIASYLSFGQSTQEKVDTASEAPKSSADNKSPGPETLKPGQ